MLNEYDSFYLFIDRGNNMNDFDQPPSTYNGRDNINTRSLNYHNDTRYNDKTLIPLEEVLNAEYSRRTGYQGKYREDNSLQLELNVPDVRLTNNDQENIKRIKTANDCFFKTVIHFFNRPQIRDWHHGFTKEDYRPKNRGHFPGVPMKFEHTFPTDKQGNLLYHPHMHAYLWMSDIYNNGHIHKNKYDFYHNPGMSKMCKWWIHDVKKNFNLKSPMYYHNKDLFFCTPGYVVDHNGDHTVTAYSINPTAKNQHIAVAPTLTNKYGHNIKVGEHQVYLDKEHQHPIYARTQYNKRLLQSNDNPHIVRKFAYFEAQEFSKCFKSEQRYKNDLKHGKRDVNITATRNGYNRQKIEVPMDKAYYAYDKATNFGNINQHLAFFGTAKGLVHTMQGKNSRSPYRRALYNKTFRGMLHDNFSFKDYKVHSYYQNQESKNPKVRAKGYNDFYNYYLPWHPYDYKFVKPYLNQDQQRYIGNRRRMLVKQFDTLKNQHQQQIKTHRILHQLGTKRYQHYEQPVTNKYHSQQQALQSNQQLTKHHKLSFSDMKPTKSHRNLHLDRGSQI